MVCNLKHIVYSIVIKISSHGHHHMSIQYFSGKWKMSNWYIAREIIHIQLFFLYIGVITEDFISTGTVTVDIEVFNRRHIALVAEWQRVRLRVRMVKVRLSLWAIF